MEENGAVPNRWLSARSDTASVFDRFEKRANVERADVEMIGNRSNPGAECPQK